MLPAGSVTHAIAGPMPRWMPPDTHRSCRHDPDSHHMREPPRSGTGRTDTVPIGQCTDLRATAPIDGWGVGCEAAILGECGADRIDTGGHDGAAGWSAGMGHGEAAGGRP